MAERAGPTMAERGLAPVPPSEAESALGEPTPFPTPNPGRRSSEGHFLKRGFNRVKNILTAPHRSLNESPIGNPDFNYGVGGTAGVDYDRGGHNRSFFGRLRHGSLYEPQVDADDKKAKAAYEKRNKGKKNSSWDDQNNLEGAYYDRLNQERGAGKSWDEQVAAAGRSFEQERMAQLLLERKVKISDETEEDQRLRRQVEHHEVLAAKARSGYLMNQDMVDNMNGGRRFGFALQQDPRIVANLEHARQEYREASRELMLLQAREGLIPLSHRHFNPVESDIRAGERQFLGRMEDNAPRIVESFFEDSDPERPRAEDQRNEMLRQLVTENVLTAEELRAINSLGFDTLNRLLGDQYASKVINTVKYACFNPVTKAELSPEDRERRIRDMLMGHQITAEEADELRNLDSAGIKGKLDEAAEYILPADATERTELREAVVTQMKNGIEDDNQEAMRGQINDTIVVGFVESETTKKSRERKVRLEVSDAMVESREESFRNLVVEHEVELDEAFALPPAERAEALDQLVADGVMSQQERELMEQIEFRKIDYYLRYGASHPGTIPVEARAEIKSAMKKLIRQEYNADRVMTQAEAIELAAGKMQAEIAGLLEGRDIDPANFGELHDLLAPVIEKYQTLFVDVKPPVKENARRSAWDLGEVADPNPAPEAPPAAPESLEDWEEPHLGDAYYHIKLSKRARQLEKTLSSAELSQLHEEFATLKEKGELPTLGDYPTYFEAWLALDRVNRPL